LFSVLVFQVLPGTFFATCGIATAHFTGAINANIVEPATGAFDGRAAKHHTNSHTGYHQQQNDKLAIIVLMLFLQIACKTRGIAFTKTVIISLLA